MTPNLNNSFEFGSGYTSDVGLRSKVIWKKPWINAYGQSLENNLSLSILEQCINISYKFPLLENPLEQYYLVQGGWIHENIYNVQSQVITLNIARYWIDSNYWQRAVNLHWYSNRCVENHGLVKSIMLVYPGISINRIQRKGVIFPYWGSSHRYSLNVSTKYWKSDINFIIAQLQNIWIYKISKQHRVLIRNNISWMKINTSLYTLPLFRLFCIKDRSIRGYEYKYKSLYDSIKYTKLITSTLEYQFNIFDTWWGAVFLDTGEITNKIKWDNFKSGIGIGIRWQLPPIGPLQIDIAIPLIHKNKINHKFFHFYISLGPEL